MFQRRRPRRALTIASAVVAAVAMVLAGAPAALAAMAVTVNTATTYQRIDGFGFSQAFGQAKVLNGAMGLSAANQRKVLDLLFFDRTNGAGFSILRNLIDSGAANTIAPTRPSSPSATPTWRWDGTDRGAANSTANSPLVRLTGDSFQTSSRLWVLANYSRFIRPGATRVAATAANSDVRVAAFRNTDGSLAVVALNTIRSAVSVPVTLRGTGIGNRATPYLTNASNNTAAQTAVNINGGTFTSTVPARSLVTYTIPARTN